MKILRTAILLVAAVLLAACALDTGTRTYRVSTFANKDKFPYYSFDYPSDWSVREKTGHLVLVASDPKLLDEDPPAIFDPGQVMAVIVVMRIPVQYDLLGGYVAVDVHQSHIGGLSASDPLTMPSAYYEGLDSATNEPSVLIVRGIVDSTGKSWAVLLAHAAAGELDTYKDDLFEIAKSLTIER